MRGPVLILTGYGNSGPQHWQSLWESSNPDFVRAPQQDYEQPVCAHWVSVIEECVQRLGPSTVVVAHSLGCLALAHWALTPLPNGAAHSPIKAALLVAVPDPTGTQFPPATVGFSPVPLSRFKFPSVVVASTDDPYASQSFAEGCAASWGSRFEGVGAAGHINAASNLGTWPAGFALLQQLRA